MIPTGWVRLSWGRHEGTSIFGREISGSSLGRGGDLQSWRETVGPSGGVWGQGAGQGHLQHWLAGKLKVVFSPQLTEKLFRALQRDGHLCGGRIRRRRAWPQGNESKAFTLHRQDTHRDVWPGLWSWGWGKTGQWIGTQNVREFGWQGSVYFTAVGKCEFSDF